MASEPPPPVEEPPIASFRLVALIEVLICSDFPTQLAVDALLRAIGYRPFDSAGQLQVGYVVGLSLADTLLLVGFVLMFLRAHGEHPSELRQGAPQVVDSELGSFNGALGAAALALHQWKPKR